MNDIVLALDLSTKNSGWCIFNGEDIGDHGVINAGSANLYHRIDKMTTDIKALVEKYKPTRVVIEEVLREDVGNNDKVFKALMYLQAFISHMLDKFNLTPEFVVVSHWRKCCGIKTGPGKYRESLKPKDIQFVKKIYNIQVGDDEADAICIGWSATHKPLPVVEEKIVKDEFGFEFA